ncbi:MAG: hypothetical protein WBP81_03185 [Solirubrobacteraceae bacterium]
MTPSHLRRVPRELVGLYWDSGVANDVPALAWFLLSSLVPLALGVTALAAVALGDYAQAQALSVRISDVLPKDVHDQLVDLILRTKEQSPLARGVPRRSKHKSRRLTDDRVVQPDVKHL